MWKAIVAGTAVLAIAGTSLVYAQQRGRPDGAERWRPSVEDMRASNVRILDHLKPAVERSASDGSDRLDAEVASRRVRGRADLESHGPRLVLPSHLHRVFGGRGGPTHWELEADHCVRTGR